MSAAVDKMMGKWKVNHSKTVNIDAWAAAMKMPAELLEKAKKMEISYDISRDGDTFTMTSCHGDEKETVTFKLGEKFVSKSMGVESENVLSMDGDCMVGEHTAFGNKTTTRRTFDSDGNLVVEACVNGVTMTEVCEKC